MSLSNACENPQLTAFDVEIKTQKYKCSLSINWYRKHILPVKIKKIYKDYQRIKNQPITKKEFVEKSIKHKHMMH